MNAETLFVAKVAFTGRGAFKLLTRVTYFSARLSSYRHESPKTGHFVNFVLGQVIYCKDVFIEMTNKLNLQYMTVH